MEKLYTVKEASALFGMSVHFYRKLISLKLIKYQKIGSAVRLTESAIKQYFDTRTLTILPRKKMITNEVKNGIRKVMQYDTRGLLEEFGDIE